MLLSLRCRTSQPLWPLTGAGCYLVQQHRERAQLVAYVWKSWTPGGNVAGGGWGRFWPCFLETRVPGCQGGSRIGLTSSRPSRQPEAVNGQLGLAQASADWVAIVQAGSLEVS